MTHRKTLLAMAIMAAAASAHAAPPMASASQPKSEIKTTTSPQLQTSHQIYDLKAPIPLSWRATSAAAQTWLNTGSAPSMVGTNGMVMYAYGQSQPTITCAPLHICVINLLPGEHITNLSIGDSVRWLVQTADAGKTPVVVVKPTAAGLTTNLAVTTDAGRVYYMTLVSDKHNYVPQIGFYDPQQLVINMEQQAAQQRAAEAAQAAAKKQEVVAPLGQIDPSTLDFNYTCKPDDGHADLENDDLLPIRVFSGSGHTYLQMPGKMRYTDAPAVFNVTNDTTELLNSRLVHGYFVIDGLPQKFKLAVGVGKDSRSVTCHHGQMNAGWWAR
ncbi:TrbG/VirB9 family P-type conjugative transfer protein [Thiomonas sp.]|uniref:TrbG/VirB9 family P-type conjugative transfer protein n=1 Tax=Thiomonas sp. TaxID=2047785 RepID=UPI002629607A|nr:TrbG/VirB9 family P-type conjugative transfer protein [Thiomonas sp.]